MKFKLFAALAGLVIMMGSAVSVQAQDTTEGQVDAQAQVDAQPQDDTQPPDDSQAQADAQPPAPDNTQVPANAQGPSNTPVQSNTDAGVARISLIHGDVSTQRGDSGDSAAAALNSPIVAGDRVSTGDNSRAEVQLDYANLLRLSERSQANIASLTRTQIQVQLGQGLATYSTFKNSEADVEIDTPNVSIRPSRSDGSYRILVTSQDETQILVRKGDAEISTPQGSTHLEKGQLMIVKGTGNDTQYKIAVGPSRDDWDRWNDERDGTICNAQAWSRTNRYYVGSEDLDAYGRWRTVPDYGQVWVPAVGSDWAPYREGRWVWEPYWGWTWVSYEPWGWAPYHYGRWFLYDSSWVWWPGPVYGYPGYRPIWAPAYVSFFGFGRGFGGGVGFGFGSIGWLPIGPCDHFYPWWGGYRSRFNTFNVNIYNGRRFGGIPPLRRGNLYSNLRLASFNGRVRGGISAVGANEFGRGRFNARGVSQAEFRGGRVVAGNLPVVPTRASLRASDRAAAPSTIARGAQSERFFTRNRPAGVRQSFDREAAQVHGAIQRDGHFTPIVGGQRPGVREAASNPAVHVQTGDRPGQIQRGVSGPANNNSNSGFRRFGQPGAQAQTQNGPGQRRAGGESPNMRQFPNSGAPTGGNRPGTVNTPADRRAPAPENNSQWRRFGDRSSGPARGTSGPVQTPAARDRNQREDSPVQNRGTDWQRFPRSTQTAPANRPQSNDSWNRLPSRGSAPGAQRDSRPWSENIPRQPSRQASRPPLDMRQPIVTPRSSAGPYGGYRGNSGGGYPSAGRPSGGGYPSAGSGGRPSSGGYSGGGGGRPSGGGGGSRPSGGGGGHSSGGGHSDGGKPHR